MVFVAGEMQRRGFYHPPADRRGHHQPHPHGGEDRAGLCRRGSTTYVLDASRAVGVVSGAAVGQANVSGCRRRPAHEGRVRAYARTVRAGPGGQGPHPHRRGSRPTISRSIGAPIQPPKPSLHRCAERSADYDLADLGRTTSTGRPSSASWELAGNFPAILDDDDRGRRPRATSTPTPR